MFTQRDWGLATRWHNMGIPVGMVLEILKETRLGNRGLARIARKVEESWEAVASGRAETVSRTGLDPGPEKADWIGRMEQAREQAPGPVGRLLDEILRKHREGREARELERILAERLPEAVPSEILQEALQSAESSLASQRGRMPPDAFRRTLERAVLSRLKAKYEIPKIHRTVSEGD